MSGMPSGVTMWVEHGPRRDVLYIAEDEITERQARLLQTALAAHTADLHDLITTLTQPRRPAHRAR